VDHGLSAVQMTWMDQLGTDRDRSEPRKTLGVLSGGAVWINAPRPEEEFVVGEGVETVLSAMLLLDLRCGAATLGPNFKALVLPRSARQVHIAADNDETGRGASEHAKRVWRSQGLKVRISMPDKEGEDFNDVWLREGSNNEQ
jgi:putative DNA primase/helicase